MTFTNLAYKIHYTRGNDIASASTLPLFTDGDYFHITGGTEITRLSDLGKGMQVVLKFDGSLIIRHDDDYLIMPEGADMIVNPNDVLRFVQYDHDGKWRMVNDGSNGGGGGEGFFSSPKSRASLGDQILTNPDFTTDLSGWTAGTGWAWDAAEGGCAKKTPGTASILSQEYPVVENVGYYGYIVVSGRTAGYLNITIGGMPLPSYEDDYSLIANDTYEGSLRAWGTGDTIVEIYASATFDGVIEEVKFYPIVQSIPSILIEDMDSSEALHISADDTIDNTMLGVNSGLLSYVNGHNICVGKDAGESLITGGWNTIIGKDAGEDLTSGHYNTLLGAYAGSSLIVGSSNTYIGYAAGTNAINGCRNTCVGTLSGNAITSASDSVFIGPHTGSSTTVGYGNVYIGPYAGENGTTANRNVCIGIRCGVSFTSASSNVLIGENAGQAVTSAGDNVLIGTFAGTRLTTGSNNILLGNSVAQRLTTSEKNIILGTNTGYYITTGNNNVVLANDTLQTATTSSNNIFLGNSVARYGDSLSGNVAIGNAAMRDGDTAQSNVVIGNNAARAMTSGLYNVVLGEESFYSNASGTENTSLGFKTGYNMTSGSHNMLLGPNAGSYYSTGYSNLVSNMNYCIMIGYEARPSADSADGEVVIGAYSPVGHGDHTLTLGGSQNTDTYITGDIHGDSGLTLNTDKFVVDGTNGNTTIAGLITATSGQILFPAVQNASANVNTLDDYEEGIFTPSLSFGGGESGSTYTYRTGNYTKIGSMVHFNIYLAISTLATSGGTGSASITGLPFTVGAKFTASCYPTAITSNGVISILGVQSGTSLLIMHYSTAGAAGSVTDTRFANNSTITITGSYIVA